MKLFVSSITDIVENHVRKIHPDSVCITEDNLEINAEIGYTSLEEFSDKTQLLDLLNNVDEIVYIKEPGKVDLHDPTSTGIGYIEYFLLLTKRQFEGKELIEIPEHSFLSLVDQRKTEGKQLWGVGCSFTFGEGVSESDRYINHLSKKINLPYSLLATPGSSIEWQADQILRSDIRKGDVVVWGLTNRTRFPIWTEGKCPLHVNVTSYNALPRLKDLISERFFLEEDHHAYNCITHISQVLTVAKKIGYDVILFGLITSPSDVFYYIQFDNFYHCTDDNRYVDLGNDGEHPGPLQHKRYAEFMYKRMKQNGLVP